MMGVNMQQKWHLFYSPNRSRLVWVGNAQFQGKFFKSEIIIVLCFAIRTSIFILVAIFTKVFLRCLSLEPVTFLEFHLPLLHAGLIHFWVVCSFLKFNEICNFQYYQTQRSNTKKWLLMPKMLFDSFYHLKRCKYNI